MSGAFTLLAGSGVSLNLANLSVSVPEQVPTPTTLSSRSTGGIAITHSLLLRMAAKEWFHGPVVRANTGVKSTTMVQEMVMMLLCWPSWVVMSTTGPGSIRVKALLRGSFFMDASVIA